MQFHGIGVEKHSAEAHHVTNCMYDHAHLNAKAGASAAKAQSAQPAQQQGEGGLSLSAWMDSYLSRGRGLFRRFWNGGQTSAVGEAGERSGQEQVLAQISESRESQSAASADTAPGIPAVESRQADLSQAVHVSRAAQAAAPAARTQEAAWASAAAAGQQGGAREGMWSRIRVRFKDIAGQLTGHLRGNTSRFQAKRSFQPGQHPTKEDAQPPKPRSRRDEVEIADYHVEESYLLDSYDRKGGYSKISTKK